MKPARRALIWMSGKRDGLPSGVRPLVTILLQATGFLMAASVILPLWMLFSYPGLWLLANHGANMNLYASMALTGGNLLLAAWVAGRCLIRLTSYLLD